MNDSSEMASAYGNMGMSHFGKDEFGQAIKLLKKASDIFEVTDRFQTLPLCYNNLADAYAASEQPRKAIALYEKSLALATEQDLTEIKSDNLLGLAQIYERLGDAPLALDYFKRYHELDKESYNLERSTMIEGLNTKYETAKKEKAIALLNADNERNQAAISTKNAQRNLFIGLSVSAALLLLIGGFSLLRIKSKNRTIEAALVEKGILLKEIHHRVKNNLQMISSLLSLQSRHVHNKQASQALRDSRNRVASVTLIHQRLYQEDNLKGVLMQEYVPQLVAELLATTDARHMEVKLDIADLNLDIDTAIPLGLITNELITNVLKYGYSESNPMLYISLKEQKGRLVLTVRDNGPGLPTNFNPDETDSYGMKLIRSLCRKLESDVLYTNVNPGLEVRLTINRYRHAA